MEVTKSLDEYTLIATLIRHVYKTYGSALTTRSLRLTLEKVERRVRSEGLGFLTKTLPRLGKALDRALTEQMPLNCTGLGLKPIPGTKLPKLFGELFSRVFSPDGAVLTAPCVNSIKHLRWLLYLFYKYELPYSDEQEQQVLLQFERTEQELENISARLRQLGDTVAEYIASGRRSPRHQNGTWVKDETKVIRRAKILLSRLFSRFDPTDIIPRHGPGAVATKQMLWTKYLWTNVSAKIRRVYPIDAYYFASAGHVVDSVDELQAIDDKDLPARVLLVPKDSRGPRLISCEPVDYQWVQQGLSEAIVRLTETHPLTRYSVFFTDQVPNRVAALIGSETGRYATLDLKEASDRVTLELVRLLFPEHIYMYLESCRSSSTVMPDGLVMPLQKFAPMGSSLCFPIMALTIWSLLAAACPGTTRLYGNESVHVYGDDVIVPTAYAEDAIELLESFGLKINRDKSCIKGFFRESCGMDAYKGTDVTPVRIRTVWSSSRSPETYASYIAYANAFWHRGCYSVYDYIVDRLLAIYGEIPSKDMGITSCPSLEYVPDEHRPSKSRIRPEYAALQTQRKQWYVWTLKSKSVDKEINGWSMLLRHFVEAEGRRSSLHWLGDRYFSQWEIASFSVRSYTRRDTSLLVKRWR